MNSVNILALHGYQGSAKDMQRQIAPLADALPDFVALTFVDAPSFASSGFRWWHEGFTGWQDSRDWIADLVAGQHFDGVIGFSQGAALAGFLLATQEAVGSGPDAGPLAFGFGVMIAGFTSEEPEHADLFRRKVRAPSLHVIGSADEAVPPRDSLRLADRFVDPVIVEHDGGHVIPSDPGALASIVEFIERQARSEA